jgi:hypothetical protein
MKLEQECMRYSERVATTAGVVGVLSVLLTAAKKQLYELRLFFIMLLKADRPRSLL